MARRYTKDDIETGDYIQLNLCEGWFRITHIAEDHFDAIDDFGTDTTYNQFEDIADLKLPSEMDYAF